MKYALVSGSRAEPQPKARGFCPGCHADTIAKCGKHVIWHWAHKSLTHCDHWWEAETEWHRKWKDRFPAEWQEVVLSSQTGERHIADVRTIHGLVIEFQRSSIDPEEVQARQAFYQSMIWVVDGCRNDTDRYYFSLARSRPNEDGIVGFRSIGRTKLFARWHTTKPVFVDFGDEHGFWRILRYDPETKEGLAGLVNVAAFVELASSGTTDFSKNGGPARG
ncbi:competence protein CoiA [Steroidobacter cummioxidans]|uniref:competence protein CoiA n=1 Tax=Steroidobacter cummioxidans TaxID=1803913 RepID=UPI000E31AD95|nr:competence protein CoiA family protein [Steroidobacter cummioxidans]